MRQQALRGGVLAVLLVVGAAGPASAAWGWLERLSGPGPFKGIQYAFPVLCYGWQASAADAAAPAVQESGGAVGEPLLFPDWDCSTADHRQMRVVFGVDVASLATNENPLTYGPGIGEKPGVRALLIVPYASVPLGLAFEAGAGVGVLRLSDRGDSGIDFSTTKLIVQPVRLTFKPLALFSDSTRWEFLQFALNGTLVAQKIEDRDFGAVPGTFREPTEMLWQATLRVDVVKLVLRDRVRTRRR